MLQNLKSFLIAFLTGIVVFGLCAVLILSAFTKDEEDVTEQDTVVTQEVVSSQE